MMAALNLVNKALDPHQADCNGRPALHVSMPCPIAIACLTPCAAVARGGGIAGHVSILRNPPQAAYMGAGCRRQHVLAPGRQGG